MDELEPRLWWSRSNRPGGGGKTWGATETKDNEPYRVFKKRCQDATKDHCFFYFPYQENTSISEEVRQSARANMSAEAFAVRALGVGATIDRVKVIQPYWIPAIHESKEPYRIRPDDNLWITFDPGWKDKNGILCGVVNRERPRHLRIVRWHSYKFGGYTNAVVDMKRWLDGRIGTGLVCDSQIHSSMQHNGRTYYTELCELLKTHKVEFQMDPLWEKPSIKHSLSHLQEALQNHGENYDPFRNSIEVDMTGEGCPAFVGELLNSRWVVDREGNVQDVMVQKALEAFDTLRYWSHFNPQWMDYGSQQPLTGLVTEDTGPIDPDVALFNARRLESERMWAEEGLEAEGQPDQFGSYAF